jgi:uncharacterized protein YjaG (DUF416 family)
MSILNYDEKELYRKLEALPNRFRVAFAAACAERQALNYLRFSKATGQGAPERVASALRRLWDDLKGATAADTDLKTQLDVCMSLLPGEGQGDFSQLGYYAEDAVASVVFALGAALEGDIQQAIWASHRAYSALDEYVNEVLDIQRFDQEQEQRILSHPLVQAELRRQLADLSELQKIAVGSVDRRDGIADLRRRAQRDAKIFFGPDSG